MKTNEAVFIELDNFLLTDDSEIPTLQLHQKVSADTLDLLAEIGSWSHLILFYASDPIITEALNQRLLDLGLINFTLELCGTQDYSAEKARRSRFLARGFRIKCYIDETEDLTWHNLGLNKLRV
jgi:hypothetical protein